MSQATALVRKPFLYLRHGETDWNARLLAQGRTDIPLNETGRAQARQAATILARVGLASVVASPLGRAQETADIVVEAIALPVATETELQEVAFGVREGQIMAEWFQDWVHGVSTPEGGESLAALRVRAVAAVNRALAHPTPVLVVGHGAVFRALRLEMGHDPDVRLPNGLPMLCTPDGDGWRIQTLT